MNGMNKKVEKLKILIYTTIRVQRVQDCIDDLEGSINGDS